MSLCCGCYAFIVLSFCYGVFGCCCYGVEVVFVMVVVAQGKDVGAMMESRDKMGGK